MKQEDKDLLLNIHEGGIQVDMAGHYSYLKNGYSSFSKMIKWRFIPGKQYYF